MKAKRILVGLMFLFAVVAAGCVGDPSGKYIVGETLDQALKAFEAALNKEDRDEARWAVVARSYNLPENPFWNLAIWHDVESFEFVSYSASVNGHEAKIVLRYTIHFTDGDSLTRIKTFTMRRFGTQWQVNLSEFLDLS